MTLTPGIASVSLSPSILEGGGSATGLVTLNSVAPADGAVVTLASSNPSATVPPSVTIAAGLSSASFTIATAAVSASTAVIISGTFPAGLTKSATLTVVPSPTPASLTLSPTTVPSGQSSTATITLIKPAPDGGSVVGLTSSLPSTVTVPATLTIPAGATSGTFTVTTVAQGSNLAATISATLNGLTKTAVLTVTRALPVGNAVFDPTLGVPRCSAVDSFCDSGGLIDGRAQLGPESNAPNTLLTSPCADGTSGTYHFDESLDRLKVSTVDGTALAAGKTVRIDATVWFWGTSDALDLYFAPDASNPAFTLLGTFVPTGPAQTAQVLSTTFVLPDSPLPVIRGNWRFGGSPSICTAGGFNDRDDLVFALSPGGPPGNLAPVVDAGLDQTITLPAAASLAGSITDDGLPNPPGAVTATWSQVSGPGTVTFANASAPATTATFSAAGSYVLRLTATDGALSSSDDVAVTVSAGGTNPCASLCSNPTNFTISGSFQSGNLGTGAVCLETTSVVHGGNCGNFVSPRTLTVNGVTETCNSSNWASVPPARNGGYCIQVTAGNQPWAFMTAW